MKILFQCCCLGVLACQDFIIFIVYGPSVFPNRIFYCDDSVPLPTLYIGEES